MFYVQTLFLTSEKFAQIGGMGGGGVIWAMLNRVFRKTTFFELRPAFYMDGVIGWLEPTKFFSAL